MIVKNTTKSIIGLPFDHKGTVVIRVVPGWNDIPDEQWFAHEVKLTDKQEIEGFGEVVKHGAETHAKSRIESGEIKLLGVAEQKDPKAPKRGKTIADLDTLKASEMVGEVNDSNLLLAWKGKTSSEEVRIAILNRLDALKPKAKG